jgi:predicted transcriptional regulator
MAEDSVNGTLLRIEKLLQTVIKAQLVPLLDKELADNRMKELYKLTGSTTAKDAAKKLKCSMTTVVDAWQRWEAMGLISKEGRQYQKVV